MNTQKACRALIFALLAAGGAGAASASSCGGLDHHWAVRAQATGDAYLRTVLNRLVLAPPDDGLSNSPGGEAFEVSHIAFDGRRLQAQTELGAFVFVLPAQATQRESDIGFVGRPEPPAGDADTPLMENEAPILRELAWQGRVQVPVRFKPFLRPGSPSRVSATLVLQGLGNGCLEAQDFKKWVLWIGDFRMAGHIAVRPP